MVGRVGDVLTVLQGYSENPSERERCLEAIRTRAAGERDRDEAHLLGEDLTQRLPRRGRVRLEIIGRTNVLVYGNQVVRLDTRPS